jgi:hypothetical protein
MDSMQRKTLLILLILSILYFLAFIPANFAASENIEMVRVFEPDEAVPLPYVLNMIQPADTFKDAIKNFIFYKYYFYGYPFFAFSALVLLPLKAVGHLGNMPVIMLLLRQMVSVLPMILSIWILVYLQTRLRGYRAVVLMLFLFSISAAIQNNFWWHPDGLAILFAMLTLFFLERDQLAFGKDFYLAAAMCGISAGIKGVGFYFFLAVFVYLMTGLFSKKITAGRMIAAALGFLGCMAGAYLTANPGLVFASVRKDYFGVMAEQSQLLTLGYTVIREKGPAAALPQMMNDFASLPTLVIVLGAGVWGAARGPRRLLGKIILAWAIPLTVMVLFLIHYKFQYWLPAALPLFSSLALILPAGEELKKPGKNLTLIQAGRLLLMGTLLFALGANLQGGCKMLTQRLRRGEDSPAINFQVKTMQALQPLPGENDFNILADIRLYTPPHGNWYFEGTFGDINYEFIQQRGFDVLLIARQRELDYLNQGVEGIDPQSFSEIKAFYRDVRKGEVDGYRLQYQDEFGFVFILDRQYERYFQ